MGLFQKPPTGSFFLFYNLIFIYFFEYEAIVISSAWSFGPLDPNPSSPGLLVIQIPIQAVCNDNHLSNFGFMKVMIH